MGSPCLRAPCGKGLRVESPHPLVMHVGRGGPILGGNGQGNAC
jgi:hypothetical protein